MSDSRKCGMPNFAYAKCRDLHTPIGAMRSCELLVTWGDAMGNVFRWADDSAWTQQAHPIIPRCVEKVGSGTCIEMPWNVQSAQWTWPLLLFSESSRGNPWKHQGCTMLAMPSLRLPFPMLVVSGQTICNSQTGCFSCTWSCVIRYHDFTRFM